MRIGDLMTTDVLTIGPDASLKEAARKMLQAAVSGLPVTDDEDNLVGIITEADFVTTEADRRAHKRAGLLRFLDREKEIPSQERLVRDVMTTDVKVIGPDLDHAEAARQMEKDSIKRFPVMDGDRLVGLVSRSDMLRAFNRPDQDIITEIKDQMRHVLWIDSKRVSIHCTDGNVGFRGQLETRTDANLLVELTKRLDGVASVEDGLTWEVDNTKLEMVGPPPVTYPRKNWS